VNDTDEATMIIIGWGDWDEQIMVWQVRGEWTADQLEEALKEGFARMSLTSKPVIGLLDMRATDEVPVDLVTMAITTAHHTPPNLVMLIVIGAPDIWQGLTQTIQRVFAARDVSIYATPSTQEAYHIVHDFLHADGN